MCGGGERTGRGGGSDNLTLRTTLKPADPALSHCPQSHFPKIFAFCPIPESPVSRLDSGLSKWTSIRHTVLAASSV